MPARSYRGTRALALALLMTLMVSPSGFRIEAHPQGTSRFDPSPISSGGTEREAAPGAAGLAGVPRPGWLGSGLLGPGPHDQPERGYAGGPAGAGLELDPAGTGIHPPGTLLVDLDDDLSESDLLRFEGQFGVDLVPLSRYSASDRRMRVRTDPARFRRVLETLGGSPVVEVAEPDYTYHALYEPNDPLFKFQWHMTKIRTPEAWDIADGTGVIVAVIDSGVAYEDHEDGGAHFFRVKDLAGTGFVHPYNFVDDTTHANDDNGHGTHVTGTIAQTTHNHEGVVGVSPRARIMPLKVLTARGSGSVGAIAQAVDYAVDHGARVINMSLGGPDPSEILERACTEAKARGVIVVCAAGNSSQKGRRGAVGFPARFPACVAVSSVRYDDTRAWYSSYGKEIAIAAPGGDTQVDQNGDGMPDGVLQNVINPQNHDEDVYLPFQGTSMAAPHVAGVAALVISLGVSDPVWVERILRWTARRPETGYDPEEYGAGILDARAGVMVAGVWLDVFRLVLALVLTILVHRRIRLATARGFLLSPGYFLGLMVGAGGLDMLHLTSWSAWIPLRTLVFSGFPQWSVTILGAERHMDPFFYSAAVPMVLTVVCLGMRRVRNLVAGFSMGVGAHLLFAVPVTLGTMTWTLLPDRVWLLANGLVCVLFAHLVLWVITQER